MKQLLPKILFLLLLWLPSLCAGQSGFKSAKATYGVELQFNLPEEQRKKNDIGDQYLEKIINQAAKIAAGIQAILQFNTEQAKFYAEEQMENDANQNLETALTLINLNGAYYSDLSKEEVLMAKEAFGKSFLVQLPKMTPAAWTITSEQAKLGDYTVFKATGIQVVQNPRGIFESLVIAWFAPEIPSSFGPLGYGGLPGLILELEIQSSTPTRYYLKSLEFAEDSWAMEIPGNPKHISKEEFEDLYKGAAENMGSSKG